MKRVLLPLLFLPTLALANGFEYSFEGKSLYGYSDSKSYNNNMPTQGELNLSYTYDIISLHLDLNGGFDKEIKSYNQGSWGQEAYAIVDTQNYGTFQVGQMYNVAKQFYFGSLDNLDFDISDFISNPNWQRNNLGTSFSTFNTTAINTDGVAPKASYITPEFYGTNLGLSYTPNAYNRRGLTTKEAEDGYVIALLNEQKLGVFDVSSSASYAHFNSLDEEYSASMKIAYGNYNISGGYKKSNALGDNPVEIFDGYRNSQAFDIGAGYDIGPYSAKLSYLQSKSEDFSYKDNVVSLSQSYQFNKYITAYVIGAYADFQGQEQDNGYALITGIGVSF